MVYRIYVEKKIAHEARQLLSELKGLPAVEHLEAVRLLNRYDVEDISAELFDYAVQTVFSEPQVDIVSSQLASDASIVLAVEYLPGQFDQRADSAAQCIQIISRGTRPLVRSARVYLLYGKLTDSGLSTIKKHIINPVDSRVASLELPQTLRIDYDIPTDVETLAGFCDKSTDELSEMVGSYGLAMDIDDICFCQQYFREEKRDPTITELRMIDTYWSDHCRHTTFGTHIDSVEFEDPLAQTTYQRYLQTRQLLGSTKPICLMDIATIATKYLKSVGRLEALDESEEINACTVKITVNVDGKDEPWLLLFKNETHNHPTEIEPFGGAATCIGGAIRDPLSGRSYVYAAMRLTGAADPTRDISETMEGKLPQRVICQGAADGYSSYGNQIGLATGMVDEIYHDGYAAKRMEIGAVIAATPQSYVRRERPADGDVVILLGGRTGRDGCGGATGSSKSHTLESLESCGAEVQKGNAPEERKLQRLFRNPLATRMIKRCNDFGAGGVSVAIGELADGLEIELDRVPKKYDGLDGTELAISESQERMAVVVEKGDADAFLRLAKDENLEATIVARVTDAPRLVMNWNGKKIVDISRKFLGSNGATKHTNAVVSTPRKWQKDIPCSFASGMRDMAGDLNICSKRGLSERFDSTIGSGTVLMPFGGKYQMTPIQAMVQKISLEKGETDDCSMMAWGYNPYISEAHPYVGAYLAVIESVSKLIATGAKFADVYLTFQEYFERLRDEPDRWGKPVSALLGAFSAQMELGIAAIGGKDSMSGSFEQMDVPPTLVSFAVTTSKINSIVSNECKKAGDTLVLLTPDYDENGLPDTKSLLGLYDRVHELLASGKAVAAYTPTYGGVAEAALKMCMGNALGCRLSDGIKLDTLFGYAYGAFVLEVRQGEVLEDGVLIGTLIEEPRFAYGDECIELSELMNLYTARLERVYPTRANLDESVDETATMSNKQMQYSTRANETSKDKAESHPDIEVRGEGAVTCDENQTKGAFVHKDVTQAVDSSVTKATRIARPRVLIPVFPGTNCEYDSARAIEAAGGEPRIFVVKNLSAEDIARSTHEFVNAMRSAQMVFIPGGFSGGDEPDGSGKFITAFFRNEVIKEAVTDLLDNREGLMCGICNGFQALIKLGLVPYGRIIDADENCPTLTYNTILRHQSRIVHTRVVSNKSPWLAKTRVGDVYSVPISHGEGRFIADEKLIENLFANGQVATQYVDLDGHETYDIDYNPNGSMYAIEGITSPDGRVFGKMGHSERVGAGLYKNVPGAYDIGMFEAAVKYFK